MQAESSSSKTDLELRSKRNIYTILIVDDDPSTLLLLREHLEQAGYRVLSAATGTQAVELAKQQNPHVVLLDVNMPNKDGFEVCSELRQNMRTFHVPIIMLTARSLISDKVKGLNTGADDYITKPFDLDELLARVQAQLRYLERGLLSELTGLPGNTLIERAIEQVLATPEKPWAVAYVDLDNFKAYNDVYGFVAGNRLIKTLAGIIREEVEKAGGNDFVGHIGGDDFVAISTPESIESLCRRIITRADAVIPSLYSDEDRKRGYIVATDRKGRDTRFPTVTVSIGVVTNRLRQFTNHWQVAKVAAEVKEKAKAISGSAYYIDQRR
ncbi:MAG: response regulator [Chloroflexi bacterium]|nr:response regulator [Chloroflexota bacterium]